MNPKASESSYQYINCDAFGNMKKIKIYLKI